MGGWWEIREQLLKIKDMIAETKMSIDWVENKI